MKEETKCKIRNLRNELDFLAVVFENELLNDLDKFCSKKAVADRKKRIYELLE